MVIDKSKTDIPLKDYPTLSSCIETKPWKKRWVRLRVLYQFFSVFNKELKNPLKALRILKEIQNKFKDLHGEGLLNKNAFEKAINAAIFAKKAGLATAFSLCATKEFVNEENFRAYMELARQLGITYVQIIDPRSTGRFKGQDAVLSTEQITLLERLYLDYNTNPVFSEYPIISYLGYHQRRIGCFGGGDSFLYIDSDGDAHLCPFCSGKKCNALELSVKETLGILREKKCHVFERAAF